MQLVRKQNSLVIVVVLYLQVFTSPFHKYYQLRTDCQTIQPSPRDEASIRKQASAGQQRSKSQLRSSNSGGIINVDTGQTRVRSLEAANETIVVTDTFEPLRMSARAPQQAQGQTRVTTSRSRTPPTTTTTTTSITRTTTTTPSTIIIDDAVPQRSRDATIVSSSSTGARGARMTYCERLARKDAAEREETGEAESGSPANGIPMFCVDYANCPSIGRERSSARVRQLTCGLKFDGTIRVCCRDFDRSALSEDELNEGRVIGADETFNSGSDEGGADRDDEDEQDNIKSWSSSSSRPSHLSGRNSDTGNGSSSASSQATLIVNEGQKLNLNNTTRRPPLPDRHHSSEPPDETTPRPNRQREKQKQQQQDLMQSKFPKDCGLAPDGYNNRDELRIIGGKSARKNAWPWFALIMVQRRRKSEPECGATLITNRHVLTAAHCLLIQGKRPIPRQQLTIRLGEFNLKEANDGEQDFGVDKIVTHPEFNPRSFKNDIALVKLNRNISSFSESIRPACLAGLDEPKLSSLMPDAVDNRTAWVLGFGQTSYNGRTSDQLRQADLKIVPHAKCKRAFAHLVKLTRDYVCASSQFDNNNNDDSKSTGKLKDSCQGDSGGPLMMMASEAVEATQEGGGESVTDDSREMERWHVYGIVSFGFKCAVPNFAGVYCRVNRYLDWIAANTDY